MQTQVQWIKGLVQLIRIIPVISWSGAGIMTTMLPIILFYHQTAALTIFRTSYLLLGGICVQGLLSHAFNDLIDEESGTDLYTKGILSGGSRVLADRLFSRELLQKLAAYLLVTAILFDCLLFWYGAKPLAIILLIGIWSSFTYSLPPFRFSYIPFLGEWLCAFPAITALSLTPALLRFQHIPEWAIQNACLHGLWSLSWLMFHHISDVEADRIAVPPKRTTVVWFVQLFHFNSSRKWPAVLYLLITVVFTISIFPARPIGAGVSLIFAATAIAIVVLSDTEVPTKHAKSEIGIIALSVVNALWLGLAA